MIPVSPQLCVQHAHKETQRRPSPGSDRTVADQGGGAGDDDHLDQSDQRSRNIFQDNDVIQSDQRSINLFFEDLDAVHDTSVGKLSESGGLEENLVHNASHL